MRLYLTVAERGVAIPVTREQLICYAGPSQVIATALMFRLFGRALADLAPEGPPERTDISVLTAFPGPGILDCIEYITRARTQDMRRLIVDTEAGPREAPLSVEGRFYFEIQVGHRRRGYWPVEGYFDRTFLEMVGRYQDGTADAKAEADYQAFKQHLIGRLLGCSEKELFHQKMIA